MRQNTQNLLVNCHIERFLKFYLVTASLNILCRIVQNWASSSFFYFAELGRRLGVRQNRNLKKECVLKHDELFHEVTLPVNFPPSRPPPSPPHTIYCLQRLKDRSIQCSGLWSFENVKTRGREEISIHLAALGFSLGARSQGHQRDRHT